MHVVSLFSGRMDHVAGGGRIGDPSDATDVSLAAVLIHANILRNPNRRGHDTFLVVKLLV